MDDKRKLNLSGGSWCGAKGLSTLIKHEKT